METLASCFDKHRSELESTLQKASINEWQTKIYDFLKETIFSSLEERRLNYSLQDLLDSALKVGFSTLEIQPTVQIHKTNKIREFLCQDILSPFKKKTSQQTISNEKIREFLKQLRDTLYCIDKVLNECNKPVTIVEEINHLESNKPLLEFLQDLLYLQQKGNADNALIKLEELENLLENNGIHCIMKYDEQNQHCFIAQPDPSGKLVNYITKQPALLKGQEILVRGRVIKPSK